MLNKTQAVAMNGESRQQIWLLVFGIDCSQTMTRNVVIYEMRSIAREAARSQWEAASGVLGSAFCVKANPSADKLIHSNVLPGTCHRWRTREALAQFECPC